MGPKSTVIYTKPNCPFCSKIKQLYNAKGWSYQELVLDVNFTRDQLYEEYGRGTTFPQLIVDGQKTGGCNETISLFRQKGWV
jgi:glutaredoxin 3